MHTLTLAGQLRSEKGEHVGSLQRLMISAGAGHGRIRPKPILFHKYTLTGRDNMRFGACTSGRINKNPPATRSPPRTTSAVQMLRLCYWQSHRAATGVYPHPTSQFLSTSSSTHRLENRIRSQPSTCHAWSYLIKIEWLSLHRRENFLFVFGYWYEQPAKRYGRTHSFFRTCRLLKSMQGNERKRWIDYAMAKFWEKCKRLDKLFVRFK